MTNVMCCSILRALVRKANEFLEYYVPMYRRMPLPMPMPIEQTGGVAGCQYHQAAKRENWYIDEETQTLHLVSSGITFPIGSEMANKFMLHLQHGCGTSFCDACTKAKR